jgi:hypothetical protein
MELPCFQTTPIANLYNPHPLTPVSRSLSFPSWNGILAAQAGSVLPINKDKDFTMQIGLLFPWQLLLSRAGVRGVLSVSRLQTDPPVCSPWVAFLANINVDGSYVIAVSVIFTRVFLLHAYDFVLLKYELKEFYGDCHFCSVSRFPISCFFLGEIFINVF